MATQPGNAEEEAGAVNLREYLVALEQAQA